MKRINFGKAVIWDTLLVVSVIFAAFVFPMLPPAWHRGIFTVLYTVIYITAILSLEKLSNYTLLLFVITVAMAWIADMLHMQLITTLSKGVNILFFLVIVVSLIKQIVSAREVTAGVILSSVAGYLLMGLIYSIFIAYILQHDPAAYTTINIEDTGEGSGASPSLYYGFVTLTTVGYGDIVPLKPYTRSLATWIAISGQFYIAIIVALLVGKFSAKQNA